MKVKLESNPDIFLTYFQNNNNTYGQKGGKLFPFYAGVRRQRGKGFGSFLLKTVLPLLKKHVLPHAIKSGTHILTDLIEGKKVKATLKKRGKEAGKNILGSFLQGRGKRKRKIITNNDIKIKKRRKQDIFDL